MPAVSASSRVGGSFSPGASSPDWIARSIVDTICCVSDRSPSRSRSFNSALHDMQSPPKFDTVVAECNAIPAKRLDQGQTMYNTIAHDSQDLTIRLARPDDAEYVRRLAQRDSAQVPHGKLLVAVVDGRM